MQITDIRRLGKTRSRLTSGLDEVFVFDSKSENGDRAVEAVESVPLGLGLGLEN